MDIIEAWNESKTIMDWLFDSRCHPEVSYDVLRRRLKRGGPLSIPEIALTTPVIKGAQKGDTKARVQEREMKSVERYKMFVLCKKIREKYNAGVERSEIKERFDISESFLQKVISNQYGANYWWNACGINQVPEHFKDIKQKVEYVPGAKDGLQLYDTGEA